MTCEHYESSLRRHAFGDPAPPELEAHLMGCAACRGALAAERELACRVDAALEESLRVEPATGCLDRVRQALAEDRAARRGGWGPTVRVPLLALVAGIVLLMVSLALLFHRPSDRREQEVQAEAITRSADRMEIPVITEADLEGFEPVREVRITRTKEVKR